MRILLTLTFLFPIFSFSQALQQEVVGSAGESWQGSTHIVGWTVGEISIEYFSGASHTVGQGYWNTCHSTNCWISVEELDKNYGLRMYPNPTTDLVFLEFTNDLLNTEVSIQITNTVGDVVLQKKLNASNAISIDISSLAAGTYIVIFSSEENVLGNEKIQKL